MGGSATSGGGQSQCWTIQGGCKPNDNLDDRWRRLAVVGMVLARLRHLLLLLLVHWRHQHPVLDEGEKNNGSRTSASSFTPFTNDEAGDAYGHHHSTDDEAVDAHDHHWIPFHVTRAHGNSTHGYHHDGATILKLCDPSAMSRAPQCF